MTDDREEQLDLIIAEFLQAEERGETVDVDELVSAHPEFASDLQEFFDDLGQMDVMPSPLGVPSVTRKPILGKLRYFGDYELLEEIARGGMGIVYKARQESLNRIVAVKRILTGHLASEEDIKRFRTEAESAANLNHPQIVSVFEVGRHEGQSYFSMEFVDGKNLSEIVRDRPLGARQAARYVREIAEAIQYAHQQGTLHRDLKPSNVLIDQNDRVQITDFGLAMRVEGGSELTRTGQILGTPSYMPPEQAQCKRSLIGTGSDIYSMGAILYELLTARPPFRAESSPETMRQVIETEPLSPRQLNPTVPKDLETICLKCLQKEPHKRYATAQQLADDLERFRQGEPIRARPIGMTSRAWRWCRRKPVVAGLSAAVMALLVGIAAVSSIGYVQTQDALHTARIHADAALREAEEKEQLLYYSEMNRAGIASRDPNGLGEIASLLERWRPQPNGVDRRGWEWFTLNSLLHQDLAALKVHDGAVSSLAWSPDGARLATSCGWGVKIWGSDGQQIGELSGHSDQVNSANWSKDGTQLVSASFDGTIRIWDPDRGTAVKTLRHEGQVVNAGWSFDDRRLGVASVIESESGKPSSRLTIWSTADWTKETEFVIPSRVLNLSWDPGQNHVAVGSRGGARILDPVTGEETQLTQNKGNGGRVAWSPDGSRLAVGSSTNMIVWDMTRREPVATIPAKQFGAVAWDPKSSSLAVVSGQKTVKVFDVSSQTERRMLRGHLNRVSAVRWHPGGERLATASAGGSVRLWSATAGTEYSAGSRVVSWNRKERDTSVVSEIRY